MKTAFPFLVLPIILLASCRRAPSPTPPSPSVSARSWVGASLLKPDSAHGKLVYQANCLRCHGITGRGDGPAGSFLNPKPANFTDQAFMKKETAQDMYEDVLSGLPNRPMPAFGDSLDDQSIVDVVTYLKKFSH